jgi:peptidoglycan/LPS O-acetylase OafA/YrhL
LGIMMGGITAVAFSAGVIAELVMNQSGRLAVVAEGRMLRWVGVRSYSLYLWHVPVFEVVFFRGPGAQQLRVLLAWTMSITLAAASYRLIERPCRSWLTSHYPGRAPALSGSNRQILVSDSAAMPRTLSVDSPIRSGEAKVLWKESAADL